MHSSVMAYVAEMVETYGLAPNLTVLEVGSYNVNGTVRPLFHTSRYTGVDMREGPGVDEVAHSTNLPFRPRYFDVVVSTEMLEHDDRPWRSVKEMWCVLRQGGFLIVTARGFNQQGCFPYHDYPSDHWRFSLGGMRALINDCGLDIVSLRDDPEAPGVFVTARKP